LGKRATSRVGSLGMCSDSMNPSSNVVTNAPVSTASPEGIRGQSPDPAVDGAWHCERAVLRAINRHSHEIFRSSDRRQIGSAPLIDFEENHLAPAVYHRFIPKENVQAKDTIDVAAFRHRTRRPAQDDHVAAKIHVSCGHAVRVTNPECFRGWP
jgi:hypothetical protein